MVAGLLVMGFLGKEGDVGATLPDGVSIEAGLAMEVVFSALMNFVYLNVAERAKVVGANGAIAVGVIVTALGIVGGYFLVVCRVSCVACRVSRGECGC